MQDAKYFRSLAIVALRKAAAEDDPEVRANYCKLVDDYVAKARQVQLLDSLAPSEGSDQHRAAEEPSRRRS